VLALRNRYGMALLDSFAKLLADLGTGVLDVVDGFDKGLADHIDDRMRARGMVITALLCMLFRQIVLTHKPSHKAARKNLPGYIRLLNPPQGGEVGLRSSNGTNIALDFGKTMAMQRTNSW